jgi:hypothetical protein
MANTKISALTAVASVAGANEFAVNEAGTSKKASGTQLAAFTSPAASDTVAGIIEIATQAEQETGTDTTRAVSPGRQHFHPSAAKFWVLATGNSATINASFNMTSWGDTAVGDADGTITTDFSSASWCGLVSTFDTTNGWDNEECQGSGFNAQAAGTFGVLCSTITDGGTAACSLTDPEYWLAAGYGDLA